MTGQWWYDSEANMGRIFREHGRAIREGQERLDYLRWKLAHIKKVRRKIDWIFLVLLAAFLVLGGTTILALLAAALLAL